MDKNTELRIRLNKYIDESGVKAKFICEKYLGGLDTSVLCRYRKGERDLYEVTLIKLEKFLADK